MVYKNEFSDDRFNAVLTQDLIDAVGNALGDAFDSWHDFLVQELEARLADSLNVAEEVVLPPKVGGEWQGVESLSRLRSLVGGRFQSIKKKWTDAGFPLRAHRGDRWKDFVLDEKGWVDLSNWILKQGFEARVTPESREFLFEIRPLSK
jgi:hypothetical protein